MKKLFTILIGLFLFSNVHGQVFSPPVGIATIIIPGTYNLTPASICGSPYHAGAIWCTTTIDFTNSFVLTYQANFDHAVGSGADGICVAFGQNITPTSINGTNALLGYYTTEGSPPNPDFNNSFGVEFDIFDNSFNPYLDDIAGIDHTAICLNAIPTTPLLGPVAISPSVSDVKDATYHNYRIEWCPSTITLKVFYNDTLRLTSVYDYRTVFTTPTSVHWGFSGGTGASCSNQLVRDIVLTPGICTTVPATCDSVATPDTLTACAGTTVVMPATLYGTDSVLSILWSPATGLSSTTILNPTLTVGTSGYYYITVQSLFPTNLVVNGDFEAGNTGFSSSYTYVSGPGSLVPESVYAISTDPFHEHPGAVSFGDHTTGSGNMMAINGASSPISVWCETISVTPFTDYNFSAWVANWSSADVGPGAPLLQFQINGVLIGTPFASTAAPGIWTNFFATWNSGVSTTATICIYDEVTVLGGNDFALDDITFQPICISKDSVYVKVQVRDTTSTSMDTTLCVTGSPLTLSGVPGYTSYLWNTGATTISISAPSSGTYWIQNINACTVLVDTFHINYIPLPIVSLGNDTGFCIGNSLLLSSPQPPGSTYLWSTSSTATSIVVNTTGTYWLRVDNGYCNATDTIHVTVSPPPVVDLGPDTTYCLAAPLILQSSVAYTAPSYLWNDGSTGSTLSVTATGTYWLQVTVGGCPGADTIHVTVFYDTFHLSNGDTAICMGKDVQVWLTADPAATFQWLPTAGIANSTIANPLITPDTSAMYVVHIYRPGCPEAQDSFFIDVQPNPQVYIGGNKTVCQFDSLHLHALVSPQWYTHYTYLWQPGIHLDDSTVANVIFRPGDSSKIVLTVTTPVGCTGADSAMLIVHPGNFAHLDTAYDLCPYDSVQFFPTGGVSYVWHPGIYLSDSTAANPWLNAITSNNYTAIATSIFGCKDTISTRVHIRPAAVLYVGDSVTLYPGESYQVNPQTNCLAFAWFPPAGLSNAYVSDPLITPEISTKYIVHGVTEWGCKAVDSINVYIDLSELLTLPNAFTPGTGVNSKLYILRRGVAKLNYFRIFNRWGNLVFETNNIDEGWDGTFNGKPQPFGVFVYQVEAVSNQGKVFQKHGNVTLIR
jgi:gliding motility-associated-like protein